MRTKIKYLSDDDKEWDTEEEATKQNQLMIFAHWLAEHPDLYWPDSSPKDVAAAILKGYTIKPL